MNGIIKRATGYDAYGYISSAINARDTESLDKLLNSPPPTGYKGTKDLQEAAKKVDKSLLDLAFATGDKKIIKKILRSECANLRSVSKETSHSALANILLQERPADREELFQIIKDQLTKEDYCALLQANEITDLLPRLFDLELGVDQETIQAMFEEAVISGYQKAAFLLFNRFPEIDLSFKADTEYDINPLENLIGRLHDYDELPYDSNDDKTAIKGLLNLLLKQGDLSELDSNLLSELFSGSATSSDIELIKSLLKNNTYTLEQDDVKEALDTIAGFDDIPATARILIRHVLQMWKKDNLDDLKLISRPLLNILSKMPEDKMREFLSLILQKDLVTEFISIKDYNNLCTHLMDQHGKKGSVIKSGLEYAKIIMAHCFWRSKLSHAKHHEEKFDREQVNVLWKKLRDTGDKEILKLALRSDALSVDDLAIKDRNLYNLYGFPNLFKESLNKYVALFKAFAEYQDSEMIKGLIRKQGFKIGNEVQFVDELLRATDEIFQVSILELQQQGLLSEKLFTALIQKISAQSTPSYKKHAILFNINPELIKKAIQKENKPLNLPELYKNSCSIDYIKEISTTKGLVVQQTDNNKNTLLHAAASASIAEDVKKVLEFTGIEVNTQNNQGFTPLMLLCASSAGNKVEIAKSIINHKSFVWSKELKDAKSNNLLLSYLSDKDGFARSNIAEYLLSIPEIATKENIRDLLLVALADNNMNVMFPDNASIDSKLSEVRDSKSFLQDAIASNNHDTKRQSIVHRLIDETTISHEELPSVMFDVYKRGISSNPSNNVDLESYKISSLIQIAEKLGTDVNVQRVERMLVPSKKQSELYVSTAILGLACAHGALGVVSALTQLKDVDLNCGTKASDKIPEMSPIMIAYSALRNNQEAAKEKTDITKDARDLNKPYIEIIKALLEKEGLDLTKEFAAGLGNISIAELLYSDPVLSEHESTRSIRKNIIDNICSTQGPSRIKDHLLMLASAAGDSVSVQMLLDHDASPLAKNEYGCHSLAIAAMNFGQNPEEYSKVIELLTSKVSIEEYKINEKDKTGSSTAHYIAAHCDLETVRKILGGIGASDFKGDSKLLIGAYSGGDANVIEYVSGLTAISDEVIRTIKDANGNTALHHVASSDNPGTDYLLKSLIERGLDVNASNNYGVTPLMSAVVSAALGTQVGAASAKSQIDKIGILLASKELDPNIWEKNGNTALMIACACGEREVIRSIINDPRVNINQTNAGMNSALMITAYRNRDQKISNIEDTAAALQNTKKKTELECDRQIVADLIRRGADPLFGKNSEAFTSKMLLIMIKTSLLTLANHFLLKFNPVLQKVGSVGIAWNTATEVGSAVGDLVTNKVVEYIAKNKIDLNGFPIVGNYHIDKFGRVISGDALKNAVDKAPQYINAKESIATAEVLDKAAKKLNSTDKFEIHNDLVHQYQHIQNVLQNSNLLPWTRRGLEKVASEIVKADRVLGLELDQSSQTIQVQDFKNNFKYLYSSIKKQNRQAIIDLMLKDDAIDLGKNTAKAKEDFKDLLQKIANGEIIADAKIVHNAKAFLDEYQKEIDSMRDTSLFAALKLKMKDLLKKIIPGMKPSKELLKSALASIANDSGKEVNERVEKLKIDHENAIKIAKSGTPEIGVFPALDKEDGIFGSVVDCGNKIFGKNMERGEAAEKLARSLGMLANIGGRLATFTAMEKDLTLGVMSPLLYYGATTTALSVAGIGGGIAAAAYGVYKGAKWLAGSGAQEVKVATNIADECSAKARQVFASHLPMTKYEGRKTATLASKSALGDEEVSNADLSYLDLLLGDATAQEQNMPFKDRIAAEQQRLTQQAI